MHNEIALTTQEVDDIVDALIPLLDSEQDAKWAIGDLLVRRIHKGVRTPLTRGGTGNGRDKEITVIARVLSAKGREVPEETLRNRYRVALALPSEARHAGVTWYAHYTIVVAGPSESAPKRMADYMAAMQKTGQLPSKRSAQAWLGITVAANEGTPTMKKFMEEHPKAVAEVIAANADVAKAVASNPAASVAVHREENKIADAMGVRDPAELDRERRRKRLAGGPTMIEILDLSIAGDKLTELARRFQTPEDGHGEYRDGARIQIEAAIAKIRAAVQHIEDVMNGAVDTRIPDDISGLTA